VAPNDRGPGFALERQMMKLMKLLVIKKEVGDAKQEDAVELLERVETLQKQHNGNSEYLEEWGYIERYIGRAV
jgi:hypothetical protein